jgi:hypothetical protein
VIPNNPDGRCRGARWVEKHADEVANVTGAVGGVCAVGAAVAATTVAGPPAAVPLAACATAAGVVSVASSAIHAAITCNNGVDVCCERALGAASLNLALLGVGTGVVKGGSTLFRMAGCESRVADGLSRFSIQD